MNTRTLSRSWLPLAAVALCLICSTCSVRAEDETESGDGAKAADKPVGASDEGELAIGTFRKPEGWSISLFAAEPELANPVAMYVDHQGRVYVCESFRQDRGVTDNRKHDQEWLLADLSANSVQDRIDYHKRLLGSEAAEYTAHDDRIRMLEDTDGDGVADKATMFAEGFNKLEDGTGAGVLRRGNDVYYTCIPNLWLLTDEDNDGVADRRKALQTGYGVRVAFRGHDSHGLIVGPDGRLYFSIGDRGYNITTEDGSFQNTESGAVFRCELDGSNLEVFATGLRNPQELAFDDYGYLFTGDNNSDSGDKARWVNVMEGGDTGWRMMYQYLPDRGPFNREKIWYPYSQETPAYIVPPIENISDGPSGLTCYPGTGLTGDYDNCFFLADFRGGPSNSGIRLIRTQPKGAFWEVERSEQPIWSILATDVDFGPDGALWICDWVDGWVGEGKGRVYRFYDGEAQKQDVVAEVKQLLADGFDSRSTESLQALLSHVDRRVRLESQWELARRGEIAPMQAVLSDSSLGTLPRLHAVWGLGHAGRIHRSLRNDVAESLAAALANSDLDVRAAAASVVGDLRLKRFSTAIEALISDAEPRVQYAACLAAKKLSVRSSLAPVNRMLATNNNVDPGLRHAGIMALTCQPPETLAKLSSHESPAVRLAAVVALRKLESPEVSVYFGDADRAVQLEAARAAHDVVELHECLPSLAEVAIGAETDPALVHRVLNANFRLGGAEATNRIAAYAATENADTGMRVEALAMLAAWGEPGKLDRVMNRYLPLPSRSMETAQQALEQVFAQVLSTSDEAVLSASLDAVESLELRALGPKMLELAEDFQVDSTTRAAAVKAAAALTEDGDEFVLKMMHDPELPVRLAAISVLPQIDAESAFTELKEAVTSEYSSERQLAWDTLAKLDTDSAQKLIADGVERYIDGKLPGDVWLNIVEASEGKLSDALAAKLAAHNEKVSAGDPLAAYRDTLIGGDVEAGERLFKTKTELSCVRCHKVAGQGGEVGPDLTNIAKENDRKYLLEAIVAPNAKIAKGFETLILLTDDGDVFSGILKSETDDEITLLDADGKTITVEADLVVGQKKGKSSMPEDLVKQMTRRELRDIIAYLATLKALEN